MMLSDLRIKIDINGYNANPNVSLSVTLKAAKISLVIKIIEYGYK